ncbi:BspA family leucine-rich repeat surface protein, partial [Pleomorphochaeta sp. DL1XJH-081]|uniref:BspA family leucine-rich repeat surface protein n=1 Tax=Pleomorphochaeta sp. DL1XJH-081 TaxID=3409690 RepID=UPI003BB5B3B1
TNMGEMFSGATSFNGDIAAWDVSNVTDMYRMFYGATSFNRDLAGWDVRNVTNHEEFSLGSCPLLENYLPSVRSWTKYTVGDIGPAGGYIFYVDGRGYDSEGVLPSYRYLEAAPFGWYDTDGDGIYWEDDDPSFEWGSYMYEVSPSAKMTGIGTGKINTENIVAYHDRLGALYPEKGDYYSNPEAYYEPSDGTVAAKVCKEAVISGYNDWYLPSLEEFKQIQNNLISKRIGGFRGSVFSNYWTSTESSERYAASWGWSRVSYTSKYKSYYIRPIRAF